MATQNREKTPPKTDIKFSITLSEEQTTENFRMAQIINNILFNISIFNILLINSV